MPALAASFKTAHSMKIGLYFVLTLAVFSNCSHDKSADGNESAEDTIVVFNTLGEEEQFLWDYFQDIEKRLEKDPEIKKENIPKIIQLLINEGELETPVLFIETEQGTQSKAVDYLTYKKYREQNPIDLKRYYVVKLPMPDTVSNKPIDSALKELLTPDSLP